jgi:hypothetical protein
MKHIFLNEEFLPEGTTVADYTCRVVRRYTDSSGEEVLEVLLKDCNGVVLSKTSDVTPDALQARINELEAQVKTQAQASPHIEKK